MKVYVKSGEVQEIVQANTLEEAAQKGLRKAAQRSLQKAARNEELTLASIMVIASEKGFATSKNMHNIEGELFSVCDIFENLEELNGLVFFKQGQLPFDYIE